MYTVIEMGRKFIRFRLTWGGGGGKGFKKFISFSDTYTKDDK